MNGTERLEAAAHVLRRTSFGPFPGHTELAVDRFQSTADLIEAQLAAAPIQFTAPKNVALVPGTAPINTDYAGLQTRWIERMMSDDAGLHEKMMWFWHSHFTTSASKALTTFCWRQLNLLHQQALGNFAELTLAMCTDGAMLQWLDGSGSTNPTPNENFARELMELFTIGRNRYTESDVRAAARAMAGWTVPNSTAAPSYAPSAGLNERVTFMDVTEVHTPETIVNRILEREEVAPFVISKLARYLVGSPVPDEQISQWADTFRRSGYEIRPVVAEILRSAEFLQSRRGRTRHGIEWLCTVLRAAEIDVPPSWRVQEWGQIPFWPLNVAGWPDRWASASSLYARAAFLAESEIQAPEFGDRRDPITAALHHCGVFEVSDATRRALQSAWNESADSAGLLRAALTTPEFIVA